MDRLLKARKERFTDSMRLEALIERFRRSGCGELRDRVFGLVGLANDVDSYAVASKSSAFTGPAPAPQPGPEEDNDQGDRMGVTPGVTTGRRILRAELVPQRGRGMLEIDYERNSYDIWCSVVEYMYCRARPLGDFETSHVEMEDERRTRLVRFAGFLQLVFEGEVEKEAHMLRLLQQGSLKTQPKDMNLLVAKGYFAGTVVHIGPTYDSWTGSYQGQRDWVASWDKHYHQLDDLAKLRQIEEEYSARIIRYTEDDLGRICRISRMSNPSCQAFRAEWEAQPTGTNRVSLLQQRQPPEQEQRPTRLPQEGLVRFLGTNLCMGLASPRLKPGDKVIRFWNCDAAIIVRRFGSSDGSYRLVGRADMAQPYDLRRQHNSDPAVKEVLTTNTPVDYSRATRSCRDSDGFSTDKLRTEAAYVRMDYPTLQQISATLSI